MRSMRRPLAALLVALALLPPLFARPAGARDLPYKWAVRGSGTWAEQSDKVGGYSYFENSERLDAETGRGLRLAVEHRWGLAGLELSYEELAFDTELTVERSFGPIAPTIVTGASGELAVRPLSLALLLHASPWSRFEVFGGPAVSWVTYSVDPGPSRDAEVGYGAVLGIEAPLGERWAAGLSARWLEVAHESVDRDYWGGLSVPSASAGVSYRF